MVRGTKSWIEWTAESHREGAKALRECGITDTGSRYSLEEVASRVNLAMCAVIDSNPEHPVKCRFDAMSLALMQIAEGAVDPQKIAADTVRLFSLQHPHKVD